VIVVGLWAVGCGLLLLLLLQLLLSASRPPRGATPVLRLIRLLKRLTWRPDSFRCQTTTIRQEASYMYKCVGAPESGRLDLWLPRSGRTRVGACQRSGRQQHVSVIMSLSQHVASGYSLLKA
jgi:hypothetical protein